ncbi:GGDEF domain-containing protein [Marinobacter alexandrii]|uniref:sensor domain-containing diguanylate cyclase n=2 Tax=Marinobacter alexandrii TaxID=2570351 RepID=UPI001FFEAE4B|nr:GGDEF domain-containing protein [Marinobacter alexandrii]MCK2148167.1 GGDEF domain-containing protein [Marinobacter alexandrii]
MPVVRSVHLITLLLLALMLAGTATAASLPVAEGWEYRWGDSPFDADGTPDWVQQDAPGEWQSIDFPSNPPDRDGQEHVWYRVTPPSGDFQEPVLYIFSVDIIFQVYLGGDKIYQYGAFDSEGRGSFEGWPWHAIPLPEDYQGKPIYFRVFSDYTDIGLWGEVAIMDYTDLVLFILRNSLEALIVAGFAALIATLTLIFSLLQTEKKTFACISLFAMSAGLMLVAESQASLLITHQPLLWDYLAAGSYYMLPVALALMLEHWLSDHRPWLINWIWKLHLVYLVGAIGLSLSGLIDLSSTFPVFDALFLITVMSMVTVAVRRFRHLLLEHRVLLVTFGVFCALLVAEMAVAHGVLPWGRIPVSWGILVFLIAVVVIALWHYARTQKALTQLAFSLEQKVAERTARAESLTRREQARVRLLTFENEKNRVLGDIITQLQDCLNLGQAYAVLTGSLPDLCSPLRGALYRRTPNETYQRLSQWGVEGEHPAMPRQLYSSEGLPRPSQLPPASSEATGSDRQRTKPDLLCFWINLESASDGQVTESLLLLESEGLFDAANSEYGVARLFAVLNQAIQRIGITLSSISLREELQKFSYEDSLTGLKNRRYFDQLFQHQCAVAQRGRTPLSLLVIDIDHFKTFNDTHGHEAGDQALQSVASVLLNQFRESDIVCRFGGEEFVVILPGALTGDGRERAQSLCDAVASVDVVFEGQNLGAVTVSVGVASWPEADGEPRQLLSLADQALYQAKEEGRNRVWIHGGQAA